MPRRSRARHFEPRYGVSQGDVEEEAEVLAREFKDYLILSLNELREKRDKLSTDSRHDWQRLHQLCSELPEREQLVVRALFFRDVYLLLQLYLCLVGQMTPGSPVAPAMPLRKTKPEPFDEFLFDIEPTRGRSHG